MLLPEHQTLETKRHSQAQKLTKVNIADRSVVEIDALRRSALTKSSQLNLFLRWSSP